MATRITTKSVETLKHDEAKRKNIPSAEQQSFVQKAQESPKQIRYPRNTDLDPQLVWRGKDEQDWSDLVVNAPPLYIQEKVHPKVLIDDLLRTTKEREHEAGQTTADLFSDFNGIPKGADKTEFYQHDQNWTNRMILGDSLQVMASLAEREGLRGRVQCIYFDPPYGIKFNSNFQWSTTSKEVKDGKADHITREPEQVKAFRDTWRDGIHSYLTYLRDRLTVARDLLTESGSIFVQIGDENVHRVRAVMDEVFGEINFISQISFLTTSGQTSSFIGSTTDSILWYGKDKSKAKYRQLYQSRGESSSNVRYDMIELSDGTRRRLKSDELETSESVLGGRKFRPMRLDSQGEGSISTSREFEFNGKKFSPLRGRHWSVSVDLFNRVRCAGRLIGAGGTLEWTKYFGDFAAVPRTNIWFDTMLGMV